MSSRHVVLRNRPNPRVAETAHLASQVTSIVLVHENAEKAFGGCLRPPRELAPEFLVVRRRAFRRAKRSDPLGWEGSGLLRSRFFRVPRSVEPKSGPEAPQPREEVSHATRSTDSNLSSSIEIPFP